MWYILLIPRFVSRNTTAKTFVNHVWKQKSPNTRRISAKAPQSIPPSGAASVPVTVAREAATFSVTVPTTLPISVDANGNVTTATDAAIINNSGAPVAVTKVELASLSDWTLAAYSRDILNLSVDAKQFGLQMNIGDKTIATSNSGTSDILSDSLNARIAKGQNCAVNYNALFPAQTAAVSDTKIANVVFTVGWA